MTGMNKVILIGNLGSDPEIRNTKSQHKVASLSLATSESFTANGEKREKTQWHRVILWNNLADLAEHFLTKGRQIMVEGKLKYRDWTDDEGNRRHATEIHADRLLMLGNRPEAVDAEPQDVAEAAKPKARTRRRLKKSA